MTSSDWNLIAPFKVAIRLGAIIIITFFVNMYCYSEKHDCRDFLVANKVYKEIKNDLKKKFPGYLSAYISEVGLKLADGGERFYPVSLKTKSGSYYSVIYHYSPKYSLCKEISSQFIKLELESSDNI